MHRYLFPAAFALTLTSLGPLDRMAWAQPPATVLTAAQWREDIDTLVATTIAVHPNPFFHTPELEFRRRVAAVRAAVPQLSREQIVVRLMAAVASLHDGHTKLKPYDPNGFDRWYPVRYYWFGDSLYVVAAGADYRQLLGARVVRIGDLSAAAAAKRAADLQGNDNMFAEREHTQYLASATALHALGVSRSADSVSLVVRTRVGDEREVMLHAVQQAFTDDGWMRAGEMFDASGQRLSCACQAAAGDTALPLHVRDRRPYWYTYLPASHTLYMQFNAVRRSADGESFEQFYRRVFHDVDSLPIDRFLLDIRYNSGGSGDILPRFVREFIKRDALNRPDRFFVLTGRKTFSAAVLLQGYLLANTSATFVGEPAGAPLNHYGDGVPVRLRHSGLVLQVSSVYHHTTDYPDALPYTPVTIPAPFTIDAYLSGDDPALDRILGPNPYFAVLGVLSVHGAAAAQAEYDRQVVAFGAIPWWRAFPESAMSDASDALLNDHRTIDALMGYRLLTEQYPRSAGAWASRAEGCLAVGDSTRAANFYRQSLARNGWNLEARDFVEHWSRSVDDTSPARC